MICEGVVVVGRWTGLNRSNNKLKAETGLKRAAVCQCGVGLRPADVSIEGRKL